MSASNKPSMPPVSDEDLKKKLLELQKSIQELNAKIEKINKEIAEAYKTPKK